MRQKAARQQFAGLLCWCCWLLSYNAAIYNASPKLQHPWAFEAQIRMTCFSWIPRPCWLLCLGLAACKDVSQPPQHATMVLQLACPYSTLGTAALCTSGICRACAGHVLGCEAGPIG